MKKHVFILMALTGILGVFFCSCRTSEIVDSKTGAQIWVETCARCHNLPNPAIFSDQEWEVSAMHMQIRANLSVEETRKVVEFLKSAN